MKISINGFALVVAIVISALSGLAYAGVWGWHVEAASQSAYGWGEHAYYSSAKNRALKECAIRTPSWDTCYVTNSWKVWID